MLKIFDKRLINNFNLIIEIIENDPNFENISDVIFLLDKHDKLRENEDPELKSAVLAVVQEVLDRKIAWPIFGYSPTAPIPDPILESTDEVLKYLDQYWGDNSIPHNDIGRSYLIFFGKDGSKLENNATPIKIK